MIIRRRAILVASAPHWPTEQSLVEELYGRGHEHGAREVWANASEGRPHACRAGDQLRAHRLDRVDDRRIGGTRGSTGEKRRGAAPPWVARSRRS